MYTSEPTITTTFPEDDGGGAPSFPPGKGGASVALVEHPDPLCRVRQLIALRRGDLEHAYELTGFTQESLVDRALGWAGVGGKAHGTARIQRAADYERSAPVQSFDVPEDVDEGLVTASLSEWMEGKTPGTYGVVHSQSFFHSAYGVFEELRALCGHPPLHVRKTAHFATPSQGTLVASSQLSPGILALAGTTGKASQVSGARVKSGEKAASKAVTRVLLSVPMVNQHQDFDWISRHRRTDLPTGGSLCGVATLRMHIWYFNNSDLSVEEQVDVIDGVYIPGQGMAGSMAPAFLDRRLGQYWQTKHGFTTTGGLATIKACLDRRYPVPVGVVRIDAKVDEAIRPSRYDLRTGDNHYHQFGSSGHWTLAIGYERKGDQLTAIFLNDPDSACRLKLSMDQFADSAGGDGSIWMISTAHHIWARGEPR